MLWKEAIDHTLAITRANIERFGTRFPHVSDGDRTYQLNDNTDWTDGFWSGILWLSYEYSGETRFRDAAVQTVESFRHRLENRIGIGHHDIGFLYSLSSKAQWIVERDEPARKLTVQAADVLMERWRERTQIFQAWGAEDDPDNGGRIIIDCLMNMPLLHWAYEHTGNEKYRKRAQIHTERSRRFLVRGDGSSYHTFYFDQQTGDSIRGGTHQGWMDGSTWTRGQAWGVYGFALAYRYLRDPAFLETSKQLALYFLERLPEDGVVYWDFDVEVTPETKRDSSASAITACGILELAEHLPQEDPDRERLIEGARRQLESLYKYYAERDPNAQGFLRRGSYGVKLGHSPDDYVIWGDYYYLEGLLRLERGIKGYWYDRK
ncbi:glycoside hydrolase family 88 protein [Paenibacillus gansuensis]|uniref:Glycoside hydrolase family 88 protein n=1 Tax=Paenibacillus gansuensis TaxID=306542 RepID=A0ABW5PAX6_9BACL